MIGRDAELLAGIGDAGENGADVGARRPQMPGEREEVAVLLVAMHQDASGVEHRKAVRHFLQGEEELRVLGFQLFLEAFLCGDVVRHPRQPDDGAARVADRRFRRGEPAPVCGAVDIVDDRLAGGKQMLLHGHQHRGMGGIGEVAIGLATHLGRVAEAVALRDDAVHPDEAAIAILDVLIVRRLQESGAKQAALESPLPGPAR